MNILILDDELTTTTLLDTILTKQGYTVTICHNGQQGLSSIKKQKPDLIISDVLMPDMDGFVFLKELQKDPALARIPLVILSQRKKMADTFLMMGARCFLSKPVSPDVVLETVEACIGKSGTMPPPSPKPQAAPLAPEKALEKAVKTVLIAGVIKNTLEEMAAALKEQYRVEVVHKGQDLVSAMSAAKPELVILDVLWEDLLTRETVRKLRKDRGFLKKPILLFSYVDKENISGEEKFRKTLDVESSRKSCLEAGATEFLGSFSDRPAFISCVNRHLT